MSIVDTYLATDTGTRTGLMNDFIQAEIALVTNDVSVCSYVLPAQNYSISDFQRDYRIEIERNGVLLGNTPFLIRKVEKILNTRGEKFISLVGYSGVDLLRRRITAYFSTASGKATWTDSPDDIMKAIIRYNLGANYNDADRDITPTNITSYFTVAADTGVIAFTTKSASRKNVLTVLQELASDAWQAGEWLGFDVVYNSIYKLEFRTYPGQLGADRTAGASALIFSPDFGNLIDVKRTWDWTTEITVAIAAGEGDKASRVVKTAQERETESIFNWIEDLVDVRDIQANDNAVQAEADAGVREGRPRDILTARVVDTTGIKFQRNWNRGDLVLIDFENERFNARIDAVRIQLNQGGYEAIDAGLAIE